jgi:hypothetical protein
VNPFRSLLNVILGDRNAEPAPDDLVLLAETDAEPVAQLWRNILERWGVQCMIKNVSALAHLRMGDRFEVYVLQRDLDYARELIADGE